MKHKLAFILGIRPDVIRAALVINQLRQYDDMEMVFIWSGQHYSDNLKSIFFRELDIAPAELDLGCSGDTDAAVVASVVSRLYPVLEEMQPVAAVFLGDTNTTTGALAAAQLNIPVVHIEGCMRSYDWRMPEEKYRTTIDHLADVIYTYFDEYKEQGVREGLNPSNIVVVGNPIVDILNHYYYSRKDKFDAMATPEFFSSRGLEKGKYYLMTCHRRENVHIPASLRAIFDLDRAGAASRVLPGELPDAEGDEGDWPDGSDDDAGRRSDRLRRDALPDGEFARRHHRLGDGRRGDVRAPGAVAPDAEVDRAAAGLRRGLERQVRSRRSCEVSRRATCSASSNRCSARTWTHTLGDGQSSERIAEDLHRRIVENDFARHRPEHYHVPIERSFRDDGLA